MKHTHRFFCAAVSPLVFEYVELQGLAAQTAWDVKVGAPEILASGWECCRHIPELSFEASHSGRPAIQSSRLTGVTGGTHAWPYEPIPPPTYRLDPRSVCFFLFGRRQPSWMSGQLSNDRSLDSGAYGTIESGQRVRNLK